MFKFYQSQVQSVSISIAMLPQDGSVSGNAGMPLNSFAILKSGFFVLFDSPFSWTVDGVRELVRNGRSPAASIISHCDLASSGDALDLLQDEFQLVSSLHATDQALAATNGSEYAFADPMLTDVFEQANVELIHIPGRTAGSVMLYVRDDGILLTGDSAVGPTSKHSAQPPLLHRPRMDEKDKKQFCEQWKQIVSDHDIRGVLPLQGRGLSRSKLGNPAFQRAIENIWNGEAIE